MAISGKTTPDEIPYLLSNDKPPDMAAATKAQADRVQALLPSGTKSDGRLVIVNSGAAAYMAMKGDATLAADGTLTIGAGKVSDEKLGSPNNTVYRLIFAASSLLKEEAVGEKLRMLTGVSGLNAQISGESAPNLFSAFHFAAGDYAVAGKTLKLRLRAQVAANATKPALKFTFGLYPITVAGGANTINVTLGTVVPGSTVEFNEPAASAVTLGSSGDFAVPADGAYVFGVVNSAKLTASAFVGLNAQLQTRNV